MDKKILAIIIIILAAIVVASGVIAYQTLNTSPASVTVIAYQSHVIEFYYLTPSDANFTYHTTFYGWFTGIEFNLNITTTKNTAFNLNNFYLTSNGEPLTIFHVDGGGKVALEKDYINPNVFTFYVEGNVTSYQLAYRGNNVDIAS